MGFSQFYSDATVYVTEVHNSTVMTSSHFLIIYSDCLDEKTFL